MFHVDVAKIDLDVAMLQVFYLDVAFSSRDLECSMQYATDVVQVFFVIIDGWIIKIFNVL